MKRKHSSEDDIVYSQIGVYPCSFPLPRDDVTQLEFSIDRTDALVDLDRSYMTTEIQILNEDGTELEDSEMVAPVNNIGYALFENCDLYINDTRITNSDCNYPWWTYIYNLLDSKKRAGQYWAEDTPGKFDSIKENEGFKTRYNSFKGSSKVKLLVPVMTNRKFERYLPAQMDIILRYTLSPANLVLMGAKDKSYKIKILSAKLFVPRVILSPHGMRKYEKNNAEFELSSVCTKTRAVSAGDQNLNWTPFSGRLPHKLYFFMIANEAYNGKIDSNPYNFETFGIENLSVLKNDVVLPISTGFGNIQEDKYQELYHLSARDSNLKLPKLENYDKGYMIIVVDLGREGDEGSVRLKVDYANPVAETLTLFCIGEFEDTCTIQKNGQINMEAY